MSVIHTSPGALASARPPHKRPPYASTMKRVNSTGNRPTAWSLSITKMIPLPVLQRPEHTTAQKQAPPVVPHSAGSKRPPSPTTTKRSPVAYSTRSLSGPDSPPIGIQPATGFPAPSPQRPMMSPFQVHRSGATCRSWAAMSPSLI